VEDVPFFSPDLSASEYMSPSFSAQRFLAFLMGDQHGVNEMGCPILLVHCDSLAGIYPVYHNTIHIQKSFFPQVFVPGNRDTVGIPGCITP